MNPPGRGLGEEEFPPQPPPWEVAESTGYSPDAAVEGDNVDGEDAGLGVPFFATDPRAWESGILAPGILIELGVTPEPGSGEPDALVILFVKEVEIGDHGCWATVRYLGSTFDWGHKWATQIFGKERKRLHICRNGAHGCKVAEERGHHVWEFYTLAAGVEPPDYVPKAKVTEWRKLYMETLARPKEPAAAPKGAGGEGVPDRIARLKAKLNKAKERGGSLSAHGDQERLPRMREREALPPPLPEAGGEPAEAVRPGGTAVVPRTTEGHRQPKIREALAQAAAQAAADREPGGRKKKKKKRSRSRSRRRRSRGRRRRSESSRSQSSSSSSSSLMPPLQRKAAKHPGSVMKLLLQNVAEALAQAAVTDPVPGNPLGSPPNQMSSYYQIIAKPSLGGKVRDCRELETLARCIDLLKRGCLPELGDALAGRFLAVESAGLTNNWADAQHLEVVPARLTGAAPPSVLLQAQRHTRQVEKASGRKTWPRPSGGQPSWNSRADQKGDHGGAKGDVRGRGKGGKKGGGKAGKGAWKDKEKAEAPPEGGPSDS